MRGMDIQHFPSRDRGCTRLPWLDSRHSFSFGHYYEPRRMGFGALRVINEDIVAPGGGFPPHSHANMEIVSIVLSGALAHRDSLGNVETIAAGEVQRMSAGTGIEHSEFNPSSSEAVHFLQVWLHPLHADRAPDYQQRQFSAEGREGRWQLAVSPDGEGDSLRIDQNARIHLTRLAAGSELTHALAEGRRAFLQLTSGAARLGELALQAGDGVAISAAGTLQLHADTDTEAVLFELS